jgi:RNA polymerase sigma factor (sigma-70 family)
MSGQDPEPTTSDAELIESARSGDTSAFAELWRRHFRPAARVARQFTSIDADDLVSEAYVRIYQRVLAGGGPTGAFRPYLYTTIRNIASTWGAANRDVQVDMIEDFEDDRIPDDPAAWALDRTLTARAFRTLPERWQTVLWYTEVEGMDPHEVAPIMGMTANGIAALSYRAREGLRKAWLQAHITDASASGECQWTMSKMGDDVRNGLSQRDAQRLTDHLETCSKCTIVYDEVDEVGSHLAMVMIPLLLGGVVGGGIISALAAPASAMAADLVIPALPHAVAAVGGVGALAAPTIAGALSFGAIASGTGALVGGIAVAAVLGSGIALGAAPQAAPADPVSVAAPHVSVTVSSAPADPSPSGTPGADDGSGAGAGAGGAGGGVVGGLVDTVDGTVGGVVDTVGNTVNTVGNTVNTVTDTVNNTVNSVTNTVSTVVPVVPPVNVNVGVNISGTGTPGAHVTLTAGGILYATTTVGGNGLFSISASIPQSAGSATVKQTDTGLVGSLLGGVLVLLKPLVVSVSSGLPVHVG